MSGRKRFGPLALVITGFATFSLTVLLGSLFLWRMIGTRGLTLLQGMAMIDSSFVGEYDPDTVLDAAMSGMVIGLGDRWSYYLNPDDYAYQQELRGNAYVGIGVSVLYVEGEGISITQVRPGGPAEQAGLQAGELIAAVDGQSAASQEDYRLAVRAIQGEVGTKVTLTVRSADGATRDVEVIRAELQEDPVASEMLSGQIGYVQIKNFYQRSADGVKEAVSDLQKQGAQALVFDMRNNGGGYLDELLPMLDFLLPEGPIFRLENRAGTQQVTESDAACVDLPMVVLVNQDTYSAAEIFAAQLQESVGAKIVGVPTSGKGYSQQTFPLPSGGAVGLSTNRYTTGGGVSLVGTGVTLDQEVELPQEDAVLLQQGRLPHEQDAQLQAALALLA